MPISAVLPWALTPAAFGAGLLAMRKKIDPDEEMRRKATMTAMGSIMGGVPGLMIGESLARAKQKRDLMKMLGAYDLDMPKTALFGPSPEEVRAIVKPMIEGEAGRAASRAAFSTLLGTAGTMLGFEMFKNWKKKKDIEKQFAQYYGEPVKLSFTINKETLKAFGKLIGKGAITGVAGAAGAGLVAKPILERMQAQKRRRELLAGVGGAAALAAGGFAAREFMKRKKTEDAYRRMIESTIKAVEAQVGPVVEPEKTAGIAKTVKTVLTDRPYYAGEVPRWMRLRLTRDPETTHALVREMVGLQSIRKASPEEFEAAARKMMRKGTLDVPSRVAGTPAEEAYRRRVTQALKRIGKKEMGAYAPPKTGITPTDKARILGWAAVPTAAVGGVAGGQYLAERAKKRSRREYIRNVAMAAGGGLLTGTTAGFLGTLGQEKLSMDLTGGGIGIAALTGMYLLGRRGGRIGATRKFIEESAKPQWASRLGWAGMGALGGIGSSMAYDKWRNYILQRQIQESALQQQTLAQAYGLQ